MPVQPGQPAPDFALYDTDKIKVTLSGLKGKNVVLLFFPFAFSSVCTKELCSVRDNISLYSQAQATVFGISVDSLYALGRFREEQKLNFGLLSDFNKDVAAAYGCLAATWNYDMKGVSKRAAFVIDGEGVVRYAEILDNPGLVPDFQAIEKTLRNLS